MNKRLIFAAVLMSAMLTGCSFAGNKKAQETVTVYSETEALEKWFEKSISDPEEFTDIKDYQYYARALGLDKDYFLSPDLWEVYYNEDININWDIDDKAVYLIRLDPYKLLDIYAENNSCSADEICAELGVTKEQLYYNWGCTVSSVEYSKQHEKNNVSYSEKEKRIFGDSNGENRQAVMNTHILTVDFADKYAVTYSNKLGDLEIRQRDLLHITTKLSCDYSDYTENEKNPAFSVNGIGIRRVLPLLMPNAANNAVDTGISVMINQSPFSFGCTDSDKVELFAEVIEETETATEISEAENSETESEAEENGEQ